MRDTRAADEGRRVAPSQRGGREVTAEEQAPGSEPDELALLEEEVAGLRRLIEDHVAVCPTAGGEGQDPAVPALQRVYGYLRLAMAEFRVLEAHLDPSGTALKLGDPLSSQ